MEISVGYTRHWSHWSPLMRGTRRLGVREGGRFALCSTCCAFKILNHVHSCLLEKKESPIPLPYVAKCAGVQVVRATSKVRAIAAASQHVLH